MQQNTFITDDVKALILAEIKNAPFIKAPFPCFSVERLFSWDLYRKILSDLPNNEEYFKSRPGRTPNPYAYENRAKISLSDEQQISSIPLDKVSVWKELNEFFTSQDFMSAMFVKYYPFLKSRFGNNLNFNAQTRLELIRDKTGYRIPPHTDHSGKIFTSLIYLPTDLANTDLGTSIYAPKDEGFRCEKGTQYPNENGEFNELYRAPYQAGRMFSFMKTDNSFHGREPIKRKGIERNLMICTIQHKETFIVS
jgi:hypothetical protein